MASGGAGETAWLIPPRVSPDGRYSFGRGLEADSVRAAVVADGAVQRERAALVDYLRGGYRDVTRRPPARRSMSLLKREGFASTAARLAREPEQLGALRGKLGILAGAAARLERQAALLITGLREGERVGAREVERTAERTGLWKGSQLDVSRFRVS